MILFFFLQDLVELRDRKWVTRNTVAAPTTIAQIHEAVSFVALVFLNHLSHNRVFRPPKRRLPQRRNLTNAKSACLAAVQGVVEIAASTPKLAPTAGLLQVVDQVLLAHHPKLAIFRTLERSAKPSL